ncbi:unnamed protein product [Camellia sinensis]
MHSDLSDSSNQLLQNPIDESESQSRNQLGQNPNDESNSESRNQVQVRWAITRRRTKIALQNAGRAETETKPLMKDEDASNPITPLVLSPSVSHDNFNHFPEKVSKKKKKFVSMQPQNLMANLPVATTTVTRSPSPTPTQNGSFVSSIPAFFPRPNPTIELFETEETQPIQPRRKVKKCPQTETETYEASPEDEWCPLLKVGDRALKCSDRAIESHYVATALSHAVLLLGDMQILEYTEDQSLETMIQHTVLMLFSTPSIWPRGPARQNGSSPTTSRKTLSSSKREAEAAKKQLVDYKASSETDLKFAYTKAYKEGYDKAAVGYKVQVEMVFNLGHLHGWKAAAIRCLLTPLFSMRLTDVEQVTEDFLEQLDRQKARKI